ncbi:MAG: radical SAM family heme chaperone HemW [Clostridia bacterium]
MTSIYIGGGTPSYINSKYIIEILELLKEKLKENKTIFDNIEKTIEINPGTVDEKKLRDYKNAQINRLSIGLQSTNNKILKEIGRIHNFEEFLETYNIAKKVGFDNINIDLMIGLPGQTITDIHKSLEQIILLNPNHVSVYSLIVEEETPIAKLIQNGTLKEIDEETERNMYWYVKNKLELNGYIHYEISNFAKKGKESKHNLNCWEQKEYIGIGVAAHSYLNNIRYTNANNIDEYINKMNTLDNIDIRKIEGIYQVEEIQNDEEKKKEYMLLGLRKIQGIQISEFKAKYVDNPLFIYRKEIQKLVDEQLLIVDGDFIRLTSRGIDLANLVWEEFV